MANSKASDVDLATVRLSPVAEEIERAVSKTPGVTGLQRVYRDENRVIWGYYWNGEPYSLTWNATGV
jgi:hypothetical protein